MDRLAYVAMTGARQLLELQAVRAHNLANLSTPGYKADIGVFRSAELQGEGLPTRAFAVGSTPAADFSPGPMMQTGRGLDVAVQGGAWLAVQPADGTEAYTRNGSLQIGADGVLRTRDGHTVLGDGGPLAVPAGAELSIAEDGTVSARIGTDRNAIPMGRLKLAEPDPARLERRGDGLFRLRGGGDAPPAERGRLVSGFLEGSNVNPAEAMVEMIAIARQFDLQMKLLQNADANDRQASQLLAHGR